MRLGGVEIPHDQHTAGHSDADVLLHAITDALLGAAGLADIGQLFPNTQEENRDRDSAEMLRMAYQHVQAAGYRAVNLDCVIAAEAPPLAPHKKSICETVAQILRLEVTQVNVKAKTGEGLGLIGERQIMEAHCVALLEKTHPKP